MAIDAVALLDRGKHIGVPQEQALPRAETLGGQRAVKIFPYRSREFRLASVGPDHGWIGLHIRKDPLEQISRHALLEG